MACVCTCTCVCVCVCSAVGPARLHHCWHTAAGKSRLVRLKQAHEICHRAPNARAAVTLNHSHTPNPPAVTQHRHTNTCPAGPRRTPFSGESRVQYQETPATGSMFQREGGGALRAGRASAESEVWEGEWSRRIKLKTKVCLRKIQSGGFRKRAFYINTNIVFKCETSFMWQNLESCDQKKSQRSECEEGFLVSANDQWG